MRQNILTTDNSKSVHNNKSLFVVVAIGLLIVASALNHSSFILLVLWVVVGVVSMIDPIYAVCAWAMCLPFESFFSKHSILNPYFGITLLLIMAFTIDIVKKEKIFLNYNALFFIGMFALCSMLSVLVGSALPGLSFRHYISLLLLLVVFYIIISIVPLRHRNVILVLVSLCFSAILATLLGLSEMDSWRLTFGDNVRSLSNALSLVSVFVFGLILEGFSKNNNQLYCRGWSNNSTQLVFLFIVLTGAHFMTISRGTIVASMFAMLLALFYGQFILRAFYKKTIYLTMVVLVIGVGIYLLLSSELFSFIHTEMIVKRFSQNHSENVRWEFWAYALQQLDLKQWIFGAGLGNFRTLVSSKYTFYAHSVYLDVLTGMGLLGLSILLIFLLSIFIKILKEKSILGMAVFTHLIVSFFPHGNISSKYFWFEFALIICFVSKKWANKCKPKYNLVDRETL